MVMAMQYFMTHTDVSEQLVQKAKVSFLGRCSPFSEKIRIKLIPLQNHIGSGYNHLLG
jgi:hypothetical protein